MRRGTTSDARGRPCPACSAGDATVTHGRMPIGGGLSFSLGPAPWGSEPLLSVALPQLPHVQQVALGTEADQGAGTPAAEAASREDCSPRFQLLGEIARGGMGAILKGRDIDLGRDLAVKVLLDCHRDRPELVRRFVEEAQIGGQLQHPGVVPVYQLGVLPDRRPFFSMKLVKGRTLSALLGSRKAAPEDLPRFLQIFEQVSQAMAYAHAGG